MQRWWPSPFGAEDELGMLNHVDESKRRQALGLVRQGRLFDLGRVLDESVPVFPGRYFRQTLVTTAHHANGNGGVGENHVNWVTEQVAGTMQLGTHLDALSHLQIGDRGYNGWSVAELAGTAGVTRLGVETVPQIVTRGWLVDAGSLGAGEVIGVDISPRMLELARRLATATGAPARWIEADVLDVPHELDSTGDLVYTGRGAIIWLHDLHGWARVLRRILAPEGRLVIFDGHPAEWLFDADEDGRLVVTEYDYFGGVEASRGWAPEYIDRLSIAEGDQAWKFARAWTLGEIVTALAGAGLRIERLVEYPVDWWAGHRDMRPEDRGRIPLSFGIVARAG
jgi:SAM-dependent methyltransferase